MVIGPRLERRAPAGGGQGGWLLLALLFLLAALGAGMAAVGTVWTTAAQREKEAELLFVGEQYRRAIESYRRRGPETAKPYPPSLEELVQDRRFPMPVRHLRRLYPDPMTGGTEWGLVRDADGGIVGVYSLSEGAPLKKAGFPPDQAGFEEAASYRDWVFKAREEERPPPADGATQAAAAPARPAPRARPAQAGGGTSAAQ
jgi:type II secretory pathway pseudopilin PulG